MKVALEDTLPVIQIRTKGIHAYDSLPRSFVNYVATCLQICFSSTVFESQSSKPENIALRLLRFVMSINKLPSDESSKLRCPLVRLEGYEILCYNVAFETLR